MQLNYAQKENGLFLLSRNNIEHVACNVLSEYAPENLERPTPLNTIGLLQDYLELRVKRNYIGTYDSGILGMIVMNDIVEIPSCDAVYRPIVLEETYGTVLINPDLSIAKNAPRRRYTEVHEGAHYMLHKPYFKKLEKKADANTKQTGIACRAVEIHKGAPQNATQWMEWQADTLAASLLMPKDVFDSYASAILHKYGVYRGYLISGNEADKRYAYDIFSEIAQPFQVSVRAAQIRMIHLGLIRKRAF